MRLQPRKSALVVALAGSLFVIGCRPPQSNTVPLSGATAEVHYSPAENLEHIDVALLHNAKRSIDFAAYSLTDLVVANALIDAAQRGVHVRIYRDQTQSRGEDARAVKASHRGRRSDAEDDEDGPATNDLGARLGSTQSVEIRVKHSHTLMHLKSYCIDGAMVRSGSANFSPTGEKRQDNDLVVMRDEESVRRFESNFNSIWQREDNEVVTP